MSIYTNKLFTEERALFQENGASISGCTFDIGESPLKEATKIDIVNTTFKGRYPIWYSNDVIINNCVFEEGSRAGIWYTNDFHMSNVKFYSPKNLRKCNHFEISNALIENAQETLWNCNDGVLNNLEVKGEYLAKGSSNLIINNLNLNGKYSFDTVKNITITNSKLITKDAFWNSENVYVKDSYISAEYIGWNSKNLTFENCVVESLQGLCYIENLVMTNCDLSKTNLAFEKSTVTINTKGTIDSIFNPISGTITCDEINDLVISNDSISSGKLIINCPNIHKKSTTPTW